DGPDGCAGLDAVGAGGVRKRGYVGRNGVCVVVGGVVGGIVEAWVEDAPVIVVPLVEVVGGGTGGAGGGVVDDGAFVGFEVGPVVPGAPVILEVEAVGVVAVQELVRGAVGRADVEDGCAEVFRGKGERRHVGDAALGDDDAVLAELAELAEDVDGEAIGAWDDVGEGGCAGGGDVSPVLRACRGELEVLVGVAEDSPGGFGGC